MSCKGGRQVCSVKGQTVVAPNHGLISGVRVSLHNVIGCPQIEGKTFLAEVREGELNSFSLTADTELTISAVDVVSDDTDLVRIKTRTPHGLDIRSDGYFDDSSQVVLQGFGSVDGLTFQAIGVGEYELDITDFECDVDRPGFHTQGKVADLEDHVSKHCLRGDESILLPDSAKTLQDISGVGGWFQLSPRRLPCLEIQAAWRASLSRVFRDQPSPKVCPTLAPEDFAIGCCGISACVGPYQHAAEDVRFVHGYHLERGCVRLAFEHSLNLWAITVEMRSSKWDDVHDARLVADEPHLRWEGPQLLYVCLDPSPLGRWVSVFGSEPAPNQIRGPCEQHISLFTAVMNVSGPLPPAELSCVFENLLDLRSADWNGYIDDFIFGCHPCGLSAGDLAHHVSELEHVGCCVAGVCRSWHQAVGAWRSLLPRCLRRILYGDVPLTSSFPITHDIITLIASVNLSMRVTDQVVFQNRSWGVVMKSICLKHIVNETLPLKKVIPAFKSFVRELFCSVGLPLSRSSTDFVRVSKPETDDESTEETEWIELLQEISNRPHCLRSKPQLLCRGRDGALIAGNGDLVADRLSLACRHLSMEVRKRHALVNFRVVHVSSEFETHMQHHQKQCWLCLFKSNDGGDANPCKRCQRMCAFTALEAVTTIGLLAEVRGANPHCFEMSFSAAVIPFIATSRDEGVERSLN